MKKLFALINMLLTRLIGMFSAVDMLLIETDRLIREKEILLQKVQRLSTKIETSSEMDKEYADWCLSNNWMKLDPVAYEYITGEGWDDDQYKEWVESELSNVPFDRKRLIYIGRDQDYDPHDLDYFPGSFMDDVYLDPLTGKLYMDSYFYCGFVEYKGHKIEYVGSKYADCTLKRYAEIANEN